MGADAVSRHMRGWRPCRLNVAELDRYPELQVGGFNARPVGIEEMDSAVLWFLRGLVLPVLVVLVLAYLVLAAVFA
jgi:hypothetical protein